MLLASNVLAEPVALAGERENVGAERQEVRQRGRQALVTEDLRLIHKLQIGRDDDARLLVKGREDARE